jgi:hypothetical protein
MIDLLYAAMQVAHCRNDMILVTSVDDVDQKELFKSEQTARLPLLCAIDKELVKAAGGPAGVQAKLQNGGHSDSDSNADSLSPIKSTANLSEGRDEDSSQSQPTEGTDSQPSAASPDMLSTVRPVGMFGGELGSTARVLEEELNLSTADTEMMNESVEEEQEDDTGMLIG